MPYRLPVSQAKVAMKGNKAIQLSALSLALVACVQTSSVMEPPSPAPASIRSLSAQDLAHADAVAWARLDEVGFSGRHALAHGGYFLDADQIAEMHPQKIADIFRHVPVLLESPFSYGNRLLIGPTPCFATYVDGLIRRGKTPSTLDEFVRVKDVVGAEVYLPDQLPPPFARSTAEEKCTTVAIWTRVHKN